MISSLCDDNVSRTRSNDHTQDGDPATSADWKNCADRRDNPAENLGGRIVRCVGELKRNENNGFLAFGAQNPGGEGARFWVGRLHWRNV